jgi:phage tail-like protein
MTQFPVNPHRLDPYKRFRFRVAWDGRTVAGVSRISGLRRRTDVVLHRQGGDPETRKSPGHTTWEPVTLERGLTHDPAFEDWANLVWSGSGSISLKSFRKDITVQLQNEAGQVVLAYHLYRCWPSAYQALPDLDADRSEVAFESLTLELEGWERDPSVTEPVET